MSAIRRPPEPLGTLEAAVMEVVWANQGPATARLVCDRLRGPQARAYTTIMTTMDRLHRKGVLTREKDGLAWRYSALLSKADFERTLAESLATKILRTHGDAALSAFVDAAAEVDEAMLERLSKLVAQRRKKAT